MKKYELTGEIKEVCGVKLHRIKALISFGAVVAGELGGWIEKEENLSQYGNAWVSGNAEVYGNADYLLVGRIGSRFRFTTFFKCSDGGIKVSCGCFLGRVAEFRVKVKEKHGENNHAKIYNLAADMAELQITRGNNNGHSIIGGRSSL